MTDRMDSVLASWADDWQSTGDDAVPSPDAIRRRARRYIWVGVGNICVGLAFLVIFTAWAILDPRPVLVVTAIAVWLFVLGGVGFDLWIRRGTWRTGAPSTREFVDLARRQLTVRLRGFQFAWGLLAAETAFFIPWIAWIVGERENVTLLSFVWPYFFLAIMVLGFGLVLLGLQRRARHELEGVLALERSLTEE